MKNATRTLIANMGTITGLAGLEHGLGEILQGNRSPGGIMFQSWPGSAFFHNLAGEPAMSIIPNLLITGILAVLLSLIFIIWAAFFVHKKNGGLVLILLSIAMLLAGGGFAPPILGVIIGAAGTRAHAMPTGGRARPSAGLRDYAGKAWSWSLSACILAWLSLVPGLPLLGYFFGVNDPSLIVILFFSALGLLLMTIFTGFAYDHQQQAG